MVKLPYFELTPWIEDHKLKCKHYLAGSATPFLSIEDLISLSSDPQATEMALNFRSLKLGGDFLRGNLSVRSAIAALYGSKQGIKPEHVITTVATTAANLTVLQGLLTAGDHVICMYPTYGQLSRLPKTWGCEVSPWKLDATKAWAVDLEVLQELIKPNTVMVILCNPANPTGSYVDAEIQTRIIDIARKHNLIIMTDEIFRPLFHQSLDQNVPSFVEHDYEKVVVTGSLSKVWGLTGVRVGWIVTKDQSLLKRLLNARQYTYQIGSMIDETIAAEVLSERCRPAILARHLGYAQENLQALQAFVDKNSDMCSWTKPTAGSTAFIKLSLNGQPIDDVEFCNRILDEDGVLLMPGSLCFREGEETDMGGYVRVHFTHFPDKTRKALDAWDRFLANQRK
ncbi:hypothetical protein LTR84_000239 [Exophiala bonariae]|uniref:Aminotransferase class I/classII large domain-containing protein n=1 Tax=Exophiala bonariae TaxID=1690606 RepID=A0AAV9NQQ4_9EURO|nr:hypothetical protein LTR84_000239 [Exophiala bonariae]